MSKAFIPGNHRQWKTGLGPPMTLPPEPEPSSGGPSEVAIFAFWLYCMTVGALLAFAVRGAL